MKINYIFFNKITKEAIQTGEGDNQRYKTLIKVLETGKMPKSAVHNKSFLLLLNLIKYGKNNIEHNMFQTGTKEESLAKEHEMKLEFGGGTCKEKSYKLMGELINGKKLNPFTVHILSNWCKHGDSFSLSRFDKSSLPENIQNELINLLGDIF